MSGLSSSLLLTVKKTMGLALTANDSLVPQAYMNEVDIHLQFFPQDINYLVISEPGTGFGKIRCLEEGCKGNTVDLSYNIKVSDGGKRDGIGALAPYQTHINEDPAHKMVRYNRANSEGKPSTSALVRWDEAFVIKPEPDEPIIPRKRPSHMIDTANSQGSLSKQAKLDPQSIHSLHAVPPKQMLIASNPTLLSSMALDRPEMAEIQHQISNVQRLLDNISKLKSRTKAQKTRQGHYEMRLESLREKKATMHSRFPAALPVKPTTMKPLILNATPFVAKESSGRMIVVETEEDNSTALDREKYDRQSSVINISDDDDSCMDTDMNDETRALLVTQRFRDALPTVALLAGTDNSDDKDDWHGGGRETYSGPITRADDAETSLLQAGNTDENAKVKDALIYLGLPDIYTGLPDMSVPLMPHQVIGTAWMLDKEKGQGANSKVEPFYGGILADEQVMGLGKTVQMISVMLQNRSSDPLCKTNLIIAPVALLDQWKMEIDLKTNDTLKCVIYHGKPYFQQSDPLLMGTTGSQRLKSKKEILKYDVVITTFTTMATEYQDPESRDLKAKRKSMSAHNFVVADSDEDSNVFLTTKKKKAGLLFDIDFYRIIADEAQFIRNRRTRVSRAIRELKSKYRWCLTGTPILNGVADVYPYYRFLQIRPWNDWSEFSKRIDMPSKMKNPDLAISRLQHIFSTTLLRRTKDMMLDGKRLIELPRKTIELEKLDFSEEERSIYYAVETQSQVKFNRYLRAGTVLKNYAYILVLLLRLRQICTHPSLIQEGINGAAFIDVEEVDEHLSPEAHKELNRARGELGRDFVIEMRKKFKETALKRIAAERETKDATVEDDGCSICTDIPSPEDSVLAPCGHVYCNECIHSHLDKLPDIVDNEDTLPEKNANERYCPMCREPISADLLFKSFAFEPSDKELADDCVDEFENPHDNDGDVEMKKSTRPSRQRISTRRTKSMRQAKSTRPVIDIDSDEEESTGEKNTLRGGRRRPHTMVIDSNDEIKDVPEVKKILFGVDRESSIPRQSKLQSKFLPSTKMKYMMDYINKLEKERPDEKIIVVSQWTSALRLVSEYLSEKSIVHVKFQGNMSRSQRDQAVRVFMSENKAKIMLMSLKCGGVGLNLTRANHVITLDLAWSQAVEAQAYDRAHRFGQIRNVEVRRLIIRNTVEDRVLVMQEHKQSLADGSLGEGKGKKVQHTVEDLANLFGLDIHGNRIANQ